MNFGRITVSIVFGFFLASFVLAQQSLPISPIIAPTLIVDDSLGFTREFAKMPTFDGITELYFTTYQIMGNGCSPVGDNLKGRHVNSLELPISELNTSFIEMIKENDLPVEFIICSFDTPPRSFEKVKSTYLFLLFTIGASRSSILLSAVMQSSSSSIYDNRAHGGTTTVEISHSDWLNVSEGAFSFIQNVTETHETWSAKSLVGEESTGRDITKRDITFKRMFNLFEISESEVIQKIHQLPLADYVWALEDELSDMSNQLGYELNYPNTIEVFQNQEPISANQQPWLGTFALP